MAARPRAPVPDKRRIILDAAVKVFARQGFTQCRVADIADEAGVAYGLVYHYFRSKDAVLDTLFLERWEVMVEVIGQVDQQDLPAREKLRYVAGFIDDSYRHDPDLMKVIIVEVTRAANSFGRTHMPDIQRAYGRLATIVEGGMRTGEFRTAVTPAFAAMAFYGVIEQVLTQWIFAEGPIGDEEFDRAKDLIVETVCGGLNG
ncbi:MAG: transcriptional regulator, TetR family [Solirubrobacterales bacterium]|nr:transcriptional regulator, TetR family [Solirubrobacterales bacterium]